MFGQQKRTHWSWDDYVSWEATQPVRHELVDGQVYAMGGGTVAHDRIANVLRVELAVRLRGGNCRPHGPDMKVQTATGNGRYPDALIDCGPYVPDAFEAQEPVAVFEVLSRSTAWVDQGRKLRDYDATPSIRHYVLISQDELRVMVYIRNAGGRLDIRDAVLLKERDAILELSDLGIAIPAGRDIQRFGFRGSRFVAPMVIGFALVGTKQQPTSPHAPASCSSKAVPDTKEVIAGSAPALSRNKKSF